MVRHGRTTEASWKDAARLSACSMHASTCLHRVASVGAEGALTAIGEAQRGVGASHPERPLLLTCRWLPTRPAAENRPAGACQPEPASQRAHGPAGTLQGKHLAAAPPLSSQQPPLRLPSEKTPASCHDRRMRIGPQLFAFGDGG